MINVDARRRSLWLCILFCLGVGGLTAIGLYYSYQYAQAHTERSLRHKSNLVAEWIIGAFAASDYVLRDIAGHIDPAQLLYPHPDSQAQQRLTQLLLDKQATVPHAFLVGAFNAKCVLTHTNAQVGFDASEREYCLALRDTPTRHTVVTHAFTSTSGHLNVTQARRLVDDDGKFVGLVAIGIDLKFFDRWLAQLDITPQTGIAIIDHHGLVLALRPSREGVVGQTILSPIGKAFLASQDTFISFKDYSSLDRVERLFGMRRVTGLPFAIVIGLEPDEYLHTWRLQVLISLPMLLLVWALAVITLRKHWALIAHSTQITEMAHTDTLTQIPNRGYFIELAERERHKAQRYRTPLSVLLLDVDRFKQINDRYGHAAGDQALMAFTNACQQVLREVDIFGRWGGDEFVVLLPGGYDTAHNVAERLRGAIAQTQVTDDQGQTFDLRTTIGFASTRGGTETVPTLHELLTIADQSLYVAKEAGRNQVMGSMI